MQKKLMIRLLVKEDDVLNAQFPLAPCLSPQTPVDSLAYRIDGWHCSLRPTTVGKTKPKLAGTACWSARRSVPSAVQAITFQLNAPLTAKAPPPLTLSNNTAGKRSSDSFNLTPRQTFPIAFNIKMPYTCAFSTQDVAVSNFQHLST